MRWRVLPSSRFARRRKGTSLSDDTQSDWEVLRTGRERVTECQTCLNMKDSICIKYPLEIFELDRDSQSVYNS